MSRIGQKPIFLPSGVTAALADGRIRVSGPRGTLERAFRPELEVELSAGTIIVRPQARTRKTAAFWGLTRALIAGMVEGVSRGFEKRLEIEGIGYRAGLEGTGMVLALGYSHPIRVAAPPGITFRVEKNAIIISGLDKERVGDTAARIRALRPPEPYKGKGIRYAGEVVRRKAGKKAATAGV